MNATATPKIELIEHEGFYYVETSDGVIAKGCKRCGGTGHYSFDGMSSICYLCNNVYEARLGDLFDNRAQAEKWCHVRAMAKANRDRKRAAEQQAKQELMERNQQALKNTDAEVYEFLMGIVIEDDTQHMFATYEEWAAQAQQVKLEKDGFIRSMAETLRWVGPSKPFTPNMIAAVRRTMERRAARAAEAEANPAPSGRVVVRGEIVSVKIKEADFGVAYKILVKDERGFKVWCSLPKAQADEAYNQFIDQVEANGSSIHHFGPSVWFEGTYDESEYKGVKGRGITFTATLEPSADDKSFAFGSRPTKGEWLA